MFGKTNPIRPLFSGITVQPKGWEKEMIVLTVLHHLAHYILFLVVSNAMQNVTERFCENDVFLRPVSFFSCTTPTHSRFVF